MNFHKLLFCLPPETAHQVALAGLNFAYRLKLLSPKNISQYPIQVMNLTFPNPIGLAAGFDKSGDYIDALSTLGFGFLEIGTITPKPQLGNPKPRLFRLTAQEAIINRMGFNNKGVDHAIEQLKKMRYQGILGINIGKNRDTPVERAIDDYLFCFKNLWPFASYITINISSPNTPGLRDLQQSSLLQSLLQTLKHEQKKILDQQQKYVPLVVKISPDLSADELSALAQTLIANKIDGVIATNTTVERSGVEQSSYAHESGGLSGKPLTTKSTAIVAKLFSILQNTIPIIASGGVMDEKTAQEKINAGAKLIQIYTGFIFQGPKLINQIANLRDENEKFSGRNKDASRL